MRGSTRDTAKGLHRLRPANAAVYSPSPPSQADAESAVESRS